MRGFIAATQPGGRRSATAASGPRTIAHEPSDRSHRALHLARAPALVVDLEIAAAVVPVGEHPALAVAPVDDELVMRRRWVWPWIIRVTLAARNAASTARCSTSMIDAGLAAVARRLLRRSHARRLGAPRTATRESALPAGRARSAHSAGSRRRRCTARRRAAAASACRRGRRRSARAAASRRRPRRSARPAASRDCRHHADGHAGVRDAAHARRDAIGHRLAQLVVADPGVEQVAEDIDARRIAGRARAERIERFDQRRPRRRQVQIGEEQRRLYRTSSARSIMTSSRRHVLVEAAVGRRHALDLVDDVLPAR